MVESGITILPTAFKILMDRNVSIHTVSGTNALTGKRFNMPQKPMSASAPSELNKPVFSEVNIKPEIWHGDIEFTGIQDFFQPIRILPGTKIKMAPGASLIFRNKLIVDGSSDNPVTVSGLDSMPWGTFALIGKQASGSLLNHLELNGGSGPFIKA